MKLIKVIKTVLHTAMVDTSEGTYIREHFKSDTTTKTTWYDINKKSNISGKYQEVSKSKAKELETLLRCAEDGGY